MLLRIIVLDRVGDNPDLDILADLLPDLLALLVVVGLTDVLLVRLALLLPDLLAFLLVLGLAHLVGDPLAGPVLLVVAFGVCIDGRALLLPNVIVDDVAAVLARVLWPRIPM